MSKGKLYDQKICGFNIMHIGWEMDNLGWIARRGNEFVLVLTSHGTEYIAKEVELVDILKRHKDTVVGLEAALALLRS